jgi:hypothetical protein
MLHEQMISIPTLAPMEELDVLMRFIRANPVQLDRYRHLRSISPNKDSKSALWGLHRNMWKDMTLSFRDQKMMMSYVEELPDHPANVAAIREYAEKFIMPNENANFLRASNPAMPGKLLLNALMRREETNLEFANKNFDLFSMCHLYNALRQLGYLSESWHALDNYIDLHIKTIFLGERPKASAQIMANRAFLSGGLHPEVVRQFTNLDNRTKNPLRLMKKKTNRTGKFTLSPFMTMLSDYLHDKETISRTLQRMDEEMVAQLERVLMGVKVPDSKNPFKSYMNDMGPLPFLVVLQGYLEQVDDYFAIDGIELSRVSTALFGKITSDPSFELSNASQRAALSKDGFGCLSLLLCRIVDADEGIPGAREIASTLANKAAGVLREYIQAGGKGVPS